MQGEVAGGDVQRLYEASAGTGHVHGLQRIRAEATRNLGSGRRFEVVAGDAAVDEQVDVACRDSVFLQAGRYRLGGELAGRERRVLFDVTHLGVASIEYVTNGLLDRSPLVCLTVGSESRTRDNTVSLLTAA